MVLLRNVVPVASGEETVAPREMRVVFDIVEAACVDDAA
jgi:hypothetical protein